MDHADVSHVERQLVDGDLVLGPDGVLGHAGHGLLLEERERQRERRCRESKQGHEQDETD